MPKQALITSRDSQGRHATGLFEAEYNKAKLDKGRAQRLNEHGDELQVGIRKIIQELTMLNRYADEEVTSNYLYPKEYKGAKSVEKQVELLLKYLPGLDPEPTFRYMHDVYSKIALPEWVEGPFLAPNEHVLAEKFYPDVKGRLARYCAGVNLVWEKIKGSRPFCNYREGQITPDRFRRIKKTAEMIDCLIDLQKGADIIVHPAQLGKRHGNPIARSVRRAREVFDASEFGEGSLEIGSIILTHPERLVRYEELDIDCPGDEFAPVAAGDFSRASVFDFNGGGVGFRARSVGAAYSGYGSGSGFLPQN